MVINLSTMEETIKLILSLIAVVVTGLVLMVATGLTVYFGFCPVNGAADANATLPDANCNCPRPPNCTAHQLCPIEPAELCPTHPLMPARPNSTTCVRPCCTPKKPIAHQWPATRPVMPKLTEEQMTSRSVLEWMTDNRPNSMERLNVLTQLMEFGVEPYIQAMTRRNCKAPYRMCTMCRSDRYEFLRCAMRTRLTANKFGYSKSRLAKIQPNFLEQFAKDADWLSQDYQGYLTLDDYQPLGDAFRAFWLVGEETKGSSGRTECTWCSDALDPTVHIDCLRTGWGSL